MSDDEKAAAAEWKEYWNQTREGKSVDEISANYDGFFAGFYRGRDYQRDKPDDRAASVANDALANESEALIANLERIYLSGGWRAVPEKVEEVKSIQSRLSEIFSEASR